MSKEKKQTLMQQISLLMKRDIKVCKQYHLGNFLI